MEEVKALDFLKQETAMGEVFANSGIFKDIKTASQAVVKILAGRELGMSPIEAMNAFYIVNDRVTISSSAIATLVKRSQRYDYHVDKLDETECVITFMVKGGDKLGVSTYSIKDAALAGIVNKPVWKNYPRNMLFSRAITNGARWYCPDALCSFSSSEEISDLDPAPTTSSVHINEKGEIVTDGKN